MGALQAVGVLKGPVLPKGVPVHFALLVLSLQL